MLSGEYIEWNLDKFKEPYRERIGKWVKALVSGEYNQGMEMLRRLNPNGLPEYLHCCLGVACEIYDPHKWLSNNASLYKTGIEQNSADLTTPVKDWYGLRTSDGMFERPLEGNYPVAISTDPWGHEMEVSTLVMLNDSGWSFGRIAQTILDAPHGLFDPIVYKH